MRLQRSWCLADIPDETTILNFRRLLETHGLAAQTFAQVSRHLARKGWSPRGGTIVDATIIAAPSSTKNQDGERDPQMHQTKEGQPVVLRDEGTSAWTKSRAGASRRMRPRTPAT